MTQRTDHAQILLQTDQVLQENPRDVSAWVARSWCLFYLSRMNDAVESADTAIAIDANSATAWEARAAALFGLSNQFCGSGAPPSRAEAIASLDRAIELDNAQPSYYWKRGVYWFASGHAAEALENADAALRLDPNHSGALCIRAMALLCLGRKEEAIAVARRAIEVEPSYGWLGLEWATWDESVWRNR
jgi:tetratricopeptide (TPR) repeat protein